MSESFWTKAKRSVKGFISNAVKAAPTTMLYSAAAFGLSAAMHSAVGVAPLHVAGADLSSLGVRVLGSGVIGATLSGAIGGFQAYNAPEQPQAPAGAQPRSQTQGRQRSTEMGMNDVVMPFTPANARAPQSNARHS